MKSTPGASSAVCFFVHIYIYMVLFCNVLSEVTGKETERGWVIYAVPMIYYSAEYWWVVRQAKRTPSSPRSVSPQCRFERQ